MTLTVVIGYDPREHEAFEVCRHSILRRTSESVHIITLNERDLRQAGLYDRPYRVDENGQFWDGRDGRPFSTAFSFSRFLTSEVAKRAGATGHVVFMDCDFILQADIAELFDLAEAKYAVQCVKHVHNPPDGLKMDAVMQTRYRRKNWSSLFLWNLDHPANRQLTPELVNTAAGGWLHAFTWLRDTDIGRLPESWNWLAGVSPTTKPVVREAPNAIHYTNGGPWFPHMRDCPFAAEWLIEQKHTHLALAGA